MLTIYYQQINLKSMSFMIHYYHSLNEVQIVKLKLFLVEPTYDVYITFYQMFFRAIIICA